VKRFFIFAAIAIASLCMAQYIPTADFRECRGPNEGKCDYNYDIGSEDSRFSDYSVRDIYHDMFTYKDGVMHIERPMKVVEEWRTATDSTREDVGGGKVKICRHSACVTEKK